jgi:hypothetical protein
MEGCVNRLLVRQGLGSLPDYEQCMAVPPENDQFCTFDSAHAGPHSWQRLS